jgi:hypothetical protein
MRRSSFASDMDVSVSVRGIRIALTTAATKVSIAQLEEFVPHTATTTLYNDGVATSSCSGGRCRRCE